ncbi:MAG: hypothetical protein M5U32_05050 [Myxococcota bacterium]|nr:hypothetical protein [Myxococcota bacterium]
MKLLLKDDGDQYFQIPRGRGFDLARLVERVRARVRVSRTAAADDDAAAVKKGAGLDSSTFPDGKS